MDSIDQLLHLRQGGLSIEEYVHQFCELSYQVPLYDEFLFKDLFHFGLNEPIKSFFHKSLFPGGEFKGSLRDFIDYALLCAGSSFTVGVAEEERNTASETEVADASECTHKMVATATGHIITAIHESGKVTASHCEPNQVTADLPEPHNRPAKPESALVVPAKPGSALVVPAKPGSALVVPAKPGSVLFMPAKPGPARVMSAMLESPAKMATMPADAPLWPGLIACVLDAPLVSMRAAGYPRAAALTVPESLHISADLPESLHVSADLPESLHVSADLPESLHVSADLPESLHVSADLPESLHVSADLPEPAPSQELAESAPSQEIAESAPQPLLVPSGSPLSPLAPSGSPSSPLVPSSSAPPERPRDSARPEYPLTFAPQECLPEVVDFPFLGGRYLPLLTETPDLPWPMESPDPSWLPEAPDLPWPPKLPASVLVTLYALSASCVSVSSRSQSLP